MDEYLMVSFNKNQINIMLFSVFIRLSLIICANQVITNIIIHLSSLNIEIFMHK